MVYQSLPLNCYLNALPTFESFLSLMKEMHLLPSQTLKLNFSVALPRSVMSAAVAALQPTNKIKQKLRDISKSRRVTARQRGWAQWGLCLSTSGQIGINQIICCPSLMKENIRCFLLSGRHQEPRLFLSSSSFWSHQTKPVSSQCCWLPQRCLAQQHRALGRASGNRPPQAPLSARRNVVPDPTARGQSCWEPPASEERDGWARMAWATGGCGVILGHHLLSQK